MSPLCKTKVETSTKVSIGNGSVIKALLDKHGDLSLDPQHLYPMSWKVGQGYHPCTGEVGTGRSLGLDSQLILHNFYPIYEFISLDTVS